MEITWAIITQKQCAHCAFLPEHEYTNEWTRIDCAVKNSNILWSFINSSNLSLGQIHVTCPNAVSFKRLTKILFHVLKCANVKLHQKHFEALCDRNWKLEEQKSIEERRSSCFACGESLPLKLSSLNAQVPTPFSTQMVYELANSFLWCECRSFPFFSKKKLSKTFRPKWRSGEKKSWCLYRFFQVLWKKRKVFRNLQERKFGCCWKVCFTKFLFYNFPIRYFESPLYIMTNRSKIWMLTEIESMHCVHAWDKLRPQHMCLQKNSSGTESVQLISNDCVSKDWINHTYLGWMVFATIAW